MKLLNKEMFFWGNWTLKEVQACWACVSVSVCEHVWVCVCACYWGVSRTSDSHTPIILYFETGSIYCTTWLWTWDLPALPWPVASSDGGSIIPIADSSCPFTWRIWGVCCWWHLVIVNVQGWAKWQSSSCPGSYQPGLQCPVPLGGSE